MRQMLVRYTTQRTSLSRLYQPANIFSTTTWVKWDAGCTAYHCQSRICGTPYLPLNCPEPRARTTSGEDHRSFWKVVMVEQNFHITVQSIRNETSKYLQGDVRTCNRPSLPYWWLQSAALSALLSPACELAKKYNILSLHTKREERGHANRFRGAWAVVK
jgi:hypothetical protein